jgi:hypothetical protein
MEGMDVAAVSGWLRSLKLDNAADTCIANGIDGFVLLALLEEEGGLESIGITSVVDRAKVRGGVKKRINEADAVQKKAEVNFATCPQAQNLQRASSTNQSIASKMSYMIKVPQKVLLSRLSSVRFSLLGFTPSPFLPHHP